MESSMSMTVGKGRDWKDSGRGRERKRHQSEEESDALCSVFSDHKVATVIASSVEFCFSVGSGSELQPCACSASAPSWSYAPKLHASNI